VRARALCRAAHALNAVTVPRASGQAARRHTSPAIEKLRWDEGFTGMPQEALPTLTAISEVVTNDGQDPRHIAEHQRGTSDTSPPAPPATSTAPALAICGWQQPWSPCPGATDHYGSVGRHRVCSRAWWLQALWQPGGHQPCPGGQWGHQRAGFDRPTVMPDPDGGVPPWQDNLVPRP
jgi:hypothetical protein